MSPNVPTECERGCAMLALSATRAEWLEHDACGAPLYGHAAVHGEGVEMLVTAALAARKAAGGTTRRCRLALGEGLAKHRVLPLPALGKSELRAVVARKAQAMLEVENATELCFAADDAGPSADGARSWLLTAAPRQRLTELLVRLRERRLRIRGVVLESLAALHLADELRREDGAASLCVAFGPTAVEVSLFDNGRLAVSEVLEGDLASQPQLATGVLQLIRTSAAYWRKSRRGAEVAEVRVLGMAPDRGPLLGQAIETALPGCAVRCEPAHDDDHPDAGRVAMLGALLRQSALAPDLSPPLPPNRLTRALGLAACVGALLGGFALVRRAVHEPSAELRTEIARLEGETVDLALMERRRAEVRDTLELVHERVRRAAALGADAPEYVDSLSSVLGALSGRAELLQASVVSGPGGRHDLRFEAVTVAPPLQALRLVRAAELALTADPRIEDVHLELPTSTAEDPSSREFRFAVSAVQCVR